MMINFKYFPTISDPSVISARALSTSCKKEYAINDKMVSFELSSGDAPAGMLLSERFKGYKFPLQFMINCAHEVKKWAVVFGNLTVPFQFQISANGL